MIRRAPQRKPRATSRGVADGLEKLWRREPEQELPRGHVVERSGVDPEQLRVAADFGENPWLDPIALSKQRFEKRAHLEVAGVPLVIEDVAAGQRRQVEMPQQRLVAQRQLAESIRVHLDDRRT